MCVCVCIIQYITSAPKIVHRNCEEKLKVQSSKNAKNHGLVSWKEPFYCPWMAVMSKVAVIFSFYISNNGTTSLVIINQTCHAQENCSQDFPSMLLISVKKHNNIVRRQCLEDFRIEFHDVIYTNRCCASKPQNHDWGENKANSAAAIALENKKY